MRSEEILISNISIGGYRSFTKSQRFDRFKKINFFIGQNNCGKSNILRFLHEVYSRAGEHVKLSDLDRPQLGQHPFSLGVSISGVDGILNSEAKRIFGEKLAVQYLQSINEVMVKKSELDGDRIPWFDLNEAMNIDVKDWVPAFGVVEVGMIQRMWSTATNRSGGGRNEWIAELVLKMKPTLTKCNVELIGAIRQIGEPSMSMETFSGEGIIDRLAKLQNPDALNQKEKKKFEAINRFLQTVTSNATASIEIPYERDTILIHMDGKVLPIASLGTGIHEVIILGAAATILDGSVICMEEPELHLNPILQKKLMRYLSENTSNQYFISTHSAALMDTPEAEIYHVKLVEGASSVERVTSNNQRSAICEDLGYHPSDLLQANCVIWVEGPSDRTYINYWLRAKRPEFIEGVHYSIMFYGGRLAAHITGEDIEGLVNDFISLRMLNRNGVIVLDCDREVKGARINDTKKRLKEEFDKGPGFAWITQGREIENYLPTSQIAAALSAVAPSLKPSTGFGQYENVLRGKGRKGQDKQASKVDFAKHVANTFKPDFSVLDLGRSIDRLIDFVVASNPVIHV